VLLRSVDCTDDDLNFHFFHKSHGLSGEAFFELFLFEDSNQFFRTFVFLPKIEPSFRIEFFQFEQQLFLEIDFPLKCVFLLLRRNRIIALPMVKNIGMNPISNYLKYLSVEVIRVDWLGVADTVSKRSKNKPVD